MLLNRLLFYSGLLQKKNITVFSILLSFFIFTANIFCQQNIKVCGMPKTSPTTSSYFPVSNTDTLKALVIFVRYQDDNFWCCPDWPPDLWTVPEWGNKVLTPMGEPITYNPSISGYFDAMSSYNGIHGWQLRGDVYPNLYVTQHPTAYYQGRGGLGAVAEEIFTNLDTKINFADYDRLDPTDYNHNGNLNEPDGYADMIILWFRWLNSGIDGAYFSGVAALGGMSMTFPNGEFITNDLINLNGVPTHLKISPGAPASNLSLASGLMGEGTTIGGINIFAHEIGHYLFGLYHTQHLGVWNLMTGNGVGIMNTMERANLGWIPDPPRYVTQYGTYYIHLQDFESTGQSYIFDTYSERYTLENRGTAGFYSKKSNWIMPGNGLLITDVHFDPALYDESYTIACADSRWNWMNSGTAVCTFSCMNMHNITFNYPFKKLEPSNNGFSNMEMHDICTSDSTGNVCRSYDSCAGCWGNLWNIRYNQVFSQWSNPKTDSAMNGKGILIELQKQNKDGSLDILVKFGVDNCETGTHPSKPMGLTASKYYFDPQRPNRFHPELDWIKNSEPDVMNSINPGKYNIYRALVVISKIEPAVYDLIQTVPANVNTFIDNSISLYDPANSTGCAYQPREYAYRVSAVDNENLESVRSDRGDIYGLIDPCETPGGDRIAQENPSVPIEFKVYNYPNPFNPSTDIKYTIPSDAYVTITIYNTLGQEILTLANGEFKKAGSYTIKFDGSNYASGIYFYRLTAGQFNATKKMLLLK